jgi:NAD(P)-dependent dehydrogenase (short-subunit alcohol dehydrogenase family)
VSTPIRNCPQDEFNKTFDVNVKGGTVQTLLPLLNDAGAIVITASIVSNKGLANLSLYSASKAAVRSFARTWANDLKARKIRANAISSELTLASNAARYVNGVELTVGGGLTQI